MPVTEYYTPVRTEQNPTNFKAAQRRNRSLPARFSAQRPHSTCEANAGRPGGTLTSAQATDTATLLPPERNGLGLRDEGQRRRAYTVTVVVSTTVLASTPAEAREMASLIGECLCDETTRMALPFMPASLTGPTSATGAVRETRDMPDSTARATSTIATLLN